MDTKQVVARFEAERQALAMMEHPNIANVLDAGTTDSGLDRRASGLEFMGRTPPAKYWAASCRFEQGDWFKWFQKPELVEERLAAAYEHLPKNFEKAGGARYGIPAAYAEVLSGRGRLARAEEVARENRGLPPGVDGYTRAAYPNLVQALCNTLCLQDRFEEALQMLGEQRRVLADRGGSEADLLRLDVLRGDVLARSGNAGEALKVFVEVLQREAEAVFKTKGIPLPEEDAK